MIPASAPLAIDSLISQTYIYTYVYMYIYIYMIPARGPQTKFKQWAEYIPRLGKSRQVGWRQEILVSRANYIETKSEAHKRKRCLGNKHIK